MTMTKAGSTSHSDWVGLAIGFVALIQLGLVFVQPINWDEFFHLSEAHMAHDGTLTESLQVLYARLFAWLPSLGLDSINELRVARLFMLGCELFLARAIVGMGRRFGPPEVARLAALAYLSGGFVFQHGFSYRADPIAAALLMGSLWLLLTARLGPLAIIAIAGLVALAFMATIKIVLYAPAFAGIAWLRWAEAEDRRALLRAYGAIAALTACFVAALLALTIATLPATSLGSTGEVVNASSGTVFSAGFFPKWPYTVQAIIMAPILAGLIFVAPREILRSGGSSAERIALAGMMAPLLSLLFYRNSFPYFYAYILAPVAVALVPSIAGAIRTGSARRLALLFAINAAILTTIVPVSVIGRQRAIVTAAHEIFPNPVAYFDFPGMIADFPKANFFMTTWGYERYHAGEYEQFSSIMSRETVPLLVVNQDVIENNQANLDEGILSPADSVALREGYVQHWGPLWVAGARIAAGTDAGTVIVRTPGVYTVEGGPVVLDGKALSAGAAIQLGRGAHTYSGRRTGPIVLRWGDHLRRPSAAWDDGPYFMDF